MNKSQNIYDNQDFFDGYKKLRDDPYSLKRKFDVVFSSLALHYIEDLGLFAKNVYSLLNDGGYFIFSQEHPLTTAPIAGASWSRDPEGNVLHYNLTDYARSGKRSTRWIVDGVEKYHRTFSEIINALVTAGFTIEKMLEPSNHKLQYRRI